MAAFLQRIDAALLPSLVQVHSLLYAASSRLMRRLLIELVSEMVFIAKIEIKTDYVNKINVCIF